MPHYTSPVAEALGPDLLERFLRYVRIDSQARRDCADSPSSVGQLELGRLLVEELRAMGVTDARQDEHGYVYATLPPSEGAARTVIGWIAHLDTSPDAPASGVEPIVHRDYGGGVIELPRAGTRIDPASSPELAGHRGDDIVTSSGDTLLGADDKAGVAAIMSAVRFLTEHPDLPRPTLRIAFTPDEEIGRGASRFDLAGFGARCAYTVDGSELGELQDESFSALEAVVAIEGVEIHPGQATGRMVSALHLAAKVVAALPEDRLTPATTAGREGFIHPYELVGSARRAEIRAILRDFDEDLLEQHAQLLQRVVHEIVGAAPPARADVSISRQYSNMRRFVDRDPAVMAAAETAMRAEGIEPIRRPIRGGTDGSLLSEKGLPTPNLFDGGHEYHSVREWASLREMAASGATLVRLAGAWAARGEE